MTKAIVVEDKDLVRIVKVASTTSAEHALRNVALIYTLFGTGLMPVEIARLRVSDYLKPDGRTIKESRLRAEAAFNGKSRPLLWTSPKLAEAVDAYLAYRVGDTSDTDHKPSENLYRSLNPDSALFLARGGEGFSVIQKDDGHKEASSMTRLLNKLLRNSGVSGATTASGRRTLAVKLYRKNLAIRDINELLGHGSLRHTQLLCKGDPVSMSQIVAGVI